MTVENISDLLHKRILVAEKTGRYNESQTLEELKILEISPSEKYIKIQNMNGQKFWKLSVDIKPIEILKISEVNPNSKKNEKTTDVIQVPSAPKFE